MINLFHLNNVGCPAAAWAAPSISAVHLSLCKYNQQLHCEEIYDLS